jgi:tetratricopeptide (TPR) repeat protein
VFVVVAVVLWFLYDRFIAPPRNVRQAMSFVASAEAAIDGGEVEAALPSFQQAVELDPEDPDNWVWLGVAHEQLGQEAEAQAAFDEGRDLYDSDLEFLLSRGMKYLRVGDIEAASSDLNQAVEQYPDAGWAYTVRANVWVAQGDYARAVADLDKASELAAAAGDTQLEAYARTQRAMVIQLQAAQPFPATDEPESTE